MLNLDYFYVPPLPETLISCISYMYKDNFNYDFLVKKITTDVGLTEAIFTVANSQYYSQGGVSTSNLKQAIIRIGSNNLLQVLSSEYYKSTFKNVNVDFFNLKDFNRHASYVSHLAVTLAEYLQVQDTNDLMIAGLFHDVGLIARSYCQHDIMQKIVKKCKENGSDFYTAEKAEVVPTHDSLGKLVAKKWSLSDRVSYLIEHHHTPVNLNSTTADFELTRELDILTFADTLAHRMKFGYDNYARDTKVSRQFLDRLGLSFETVAKKTQESFNAVSALAF